MPTRPNEACGHLLRSGDQRMWIAGDTSLYPEMDDLPDLAGGPIDLAVVPIHGWGPRLSGGHMNPERAAHACAMIGAAAAMPYHWGSLLRARHAAAPARLDGPPGPGLRRRRWREKRPAAAPSCWLPDETTEVGA